MNNAETINAITMAAVKSKHLDPLEAIAILSHTIGIMNSVRDDAALDPVCMQVFERYDWIMHSKQAPWTDLWNELLLEELK